MIAQIYPIRKLPAHTGPFDYTVPDEARRGDLVEITFKGWRMQGVIWEILKKTEQSRIIPIERILQKGYMQPGDLNRLHALAQITIQSPASYLTVLNTDNKQKQKQEVFPELQYTKEEIEGAKNNTESAVFCAARLWPLHILARAKTKGNHIVICPNDEIAHYIAFHIQKKKLAGRNIVICVRHASLQAQKDVQSIFILDEAHPDYEFRPRNPRYDPRFAAYLLAKQHKAALYRIGHTNSLSVFKETHEIPSKTAQEESNKTQLIDTSKHPANHPYLTNPIVTAIEQAIENKERVILFLNKSGIATHFQCRACGHLPTCGTCGSIPIIRKDDLICPTCQVEMWHPAQCPSCGKKTLTKKGIGIEHVQASLETLFPQKTHAIYGEKTILPKTWDTLIVSEYGFRQLDTHTQSQIGLFIDLCADYHFLNDSYACDEMGRYKLIRFLHIAQAHKAASMIQTYQGTRIQEILHANWPQKELNLRQKHALPPYSVEFQIHYENGSEEIRRSIDKTTILQYLEDFRALGRKDTIEVHPQIIAYECITSPE